MTKISRIECHLFSGLAGVGAKAGTETLTKLLNALPLELDAKHHPHGEWTQACDGILGRAKKFGPSITILIGHSFGARRCQQIALKLNKAKFGVDYIAGIDPTALIPNFPFFHQPMVVPGNVRRVDEFHATSGIPFSARRQFPDGSHGGKYIYPDKFSGEHNLFTIKTDHLGSAKSKFTREQILKSTIELVGLDLIA